MLQLALAASLFLTAAPAAAESPERTFLDPLLGEWKVTGQIRGKPVTQKLTARRVLGGRFVELHFVGSAPARHGMPPYEVLLFVGWDEKEKRYVAHWLDVFGAGGSEPVGHGALKDGALVLEFPYPDGTFRDTLSFDAKAKRWRFVIEAQEADGKWSSFAEESFAK